MASSIPRKSSAKTPAGATAKPAVKAAVSAAKKLTSPVRVAVKKLTTAPATTAKKISAAGKRTGLGKSDEIVDNSNANDTEATTSAAKTSRIRAVKKIKKAKLVRDSFMMPEAEYAALGEVKRACLKAGFEVKKSELLRIGVALVRKLALSSLKHEVGQLMPLKPGRPRKEKAAEK